MTDRHSRVTLQQEACEGPADDLAAPNDTRIRTCDLDTVSIQQFDNSGWSARNESGSSHSQQTDVSGMKRVHIFGRINCLDHQTVINLFRQRQLDENAVELIVVV